MRVIIKVLCTCLLLAGNLPSLEAYTNNNKSGSDVSLTILEVQVDNENCNRSDGTINVVVDINSPDVEYSIDGGTTWQSSSYFDGLEAGDYLVVASLNGGCTDIFTSQISQLDPPMLMMTQECVPGKNRTAIIPNAEGGNRNYSYEWSGPNGINQGNSSLDNLPPGFYTVTVSDDLGCSSSDTITINECCELEVICNLSPIQVDCLGDIPQEDLRLSQPGSSQSELISALEDLGITATNACTDLEVQYEENIGTSATCADGDLIITREFRVKDVYAEYPCSYEIIVAQHVEPTILNNAEEINTQCADTAQQEFDQWIANH